MVFCDTSQLFWLRYQPAPDESFDDVVALVQSTLPMILGSYMVERIRAGCRVVDVLYCTQYRCRRTAVWSRDKWQRKRARGFIVDVDRPGLDEMSEAFLERWARNMTADPTIQTAGSVEGVFQALEVFLGGERDRLRERRNRPRESVVASS